MNKDKLKVAIYCRVGTTEQLETNIQESKIQNYCKQKGYEVFKSYIDNGYSANDKTRPSYNLMLDDLKQKRFDMIITNDISRLCRSTSNLERFLNLIERYNCNLTILNEKIDTSTAVGKLFIRTLTIFNNELRRILTNE